MAKVSPLRSDGESASDSGAHANKKTKKVAKDVEEDGMEVDDAENGEEDSGEEEEYEIEAILDARRGSFPEGRMGYLVKWKGYDESENSWVDEIDAGNATALIEEYWRTHGKKPKKPADAKTPKRPRKSSAAAEEVSDTSTKKRARKSQTAVASVEDDEEVKGIRVAKKAKKNGAVKEKSEEFPTPDTDEVVLTDMSKYMGVSSWEHLVKTIDTIEKENDGSLAVYFSLIGGERIKENSKLCAERFPQKLIAFYESNLRWKTASGHEDES
ncbi:putative chromo shadow domain containing protein [Lyophyllum shimeji]|uniref:Chromo shadow domain containing protein n=1 Tax=Lyophyllum shimeji TaxID=47721 RepID=A0A9P3PUX4_LYOSH|nr:putative chromo shadow domain containing protein [Lyophyllum shimeji]